MSAAPRKQKAATRQNSLKLSHEELLHRQKDTIQSILGRSPNVKPKTENQGLLLELIRNREVVFVAGLAGSGKTFLSLAEALRQIYERDTPYTKIYLVKSVVTLKGEEIGFLKGTMEEKLEPFLWSFIGNLSKIVEEDKIRDLFAAGFIKPVPIAYLRGMNFDNAIVVVDEAQNITTENLRTVMTRLGESSKLIIAGDERQVDLKDKATSSLSIVYEMMAEVEEIGRIRMAEQDIVRNPLIRKIEKCFEEHSTRKSPTTLRQLIKS